jgi:hypothetical protein
METIGSYVALKRNKLSTYTNQAFFVAMRIRDLNSFPFAAQQK